MYFAPSRRISPAAFSVAAVDNPAAHNTRLEIGGPSYSWQEIVGAVGQALGQELSVRFVPPGGELPLLDPGVSGWLSGFETYEDFIDMGELPARFGVELTPIPTVMEQMYGFFASTLLYVD